MASESSTTPNEFKKQGESPREQEAQNAIRSRTGRRVIIIEKGDVPTKKIKKISPKERKNKIRSVENMYRYNYREEKRGIGYTPFPKLEASTLTVLGALSRPIDLDVIFPALEITKVKFERKNTKKVKLDVVGPPGSILSARYRNSNHEDFVRGIDKGSGFFLHCIALDISLKDKNVSFKLFSNSVQFTGCKDMDQACDAVHYVMQHLRSLYEKGIPIYSAQKEGDCDLDEPVSAINLEVIMRNFDFFLGTTIDREVLARLMKQFEDFHTSYEAGINNGVSIKALVDPNRVEYTQTGKVKRKKPKTHSFIVFQSGSVIQSGKDLGAMEKVYNTFRKCIQQIEDDIKDD